MNFFRKLFRTGLAVILLLSICIGAVSCGELGGNVVKVNKTFKAGSSSIKHPIGSETADGGWAVELEDGIETMMQWNIKLEPGSYVLKSDVMTDVQVPDPVLLLEMRISPKDDLYNLIGAGGAYSSEFTSQLTYRQYEVPFKVEKKGTYTVRYYVRGQGYVRVGDVTLQSVKEGTYTKKPLDNFLAETDEELAMEYNPNALYKLDLREFAKGLTNYKLQYDLYAVITTLQGLANVDEPHIFIIGTGKYQKDLKNDLNIDQYWFDYLDTHERSPWKGKEVIEVRNPITLIRLFKDYYNGVVAWDWDVPATVNVAYTASGVEGLLPICYSEEADSLYYYLITDKQILPTPILNLNDKFTGEEGTTIWGTERESSGSAKNDAYRYAIDKYIKTGKTDPHWVACYIDTFLSYDGVFPSLTAIPTNQTIERAEVVNRDYFIGKKAFFFDLDVWSDSYPTDDPNQYPGTDLETLREILYECNIRTDGEIIHCGGFVPWQNKYTEQSPYAEFDARGDVETEWQSIKIYSEYNVVVEADAQSDIANASVYQHFEQKEQYKSVAKEKTNIVDSQKPEQKNYLLFYMGDYDSPAWLMKNMVSIWSDPNRGQIPLCWPIIPVDEGRAGFVFDYMYTTATNNDYFVGGDNGYGYLNPFWLYDMQERRDPNIKGTVDDFVALTKEKYQKWDIDVQGLLINTGTESEEAIKYVYQEYVDKLRVRGIFGNFETGKTINKAITSTDGELTAPIRKYEDVGLAYAGANNKPGLQIVRERALSKDYFEKNPKVAPTFTILRSIISTPSQALNFLNVLRSTYPDCEFEVIDPYTFCSYLNYVNENY